ncbi:hypothetical protein CPB83DRAFT_605463 [Crepidotus variabilis]|uniref:Uncharacterized protein n=1 Tax=Crepidotus variabilis TaxID=179855 RepID=A0A9P6E8Q8_9AGAR|nr:hypothetical protein CPB83DRAFT_605463 [Crepidotus variabilis]
MMALIRCSAGNQLSSWKETTMVVSCTCNVTMAHSQTFNCLCPTKVPDMDNEIIKLCTERHFTVKQALLLGCHCEGPHIISIPFVPGHVATSGKTTELNIEMWLPSMKSSGTSVIPSRPSFARRLKHHAKGVLFEYRVFYYDQVSKKKTIIWFFFC